MTTINGTAGNDTLHDTSGNDVIYGYGGDDAVTITGGSDLANGGNGYNSLIVDYSWATSPVIMTEPSSSAPGSSGEIYIGGARALAYSHFSFFNVTGGSGADVLYGEYLTGGAGADILYGDYVSGGDGDDLIVTSGFTPVDGGDGNDTVSYVNSPGYTYDISGHWFTDGIYVDLSAGTGGVDGEVQLLGIENVIGSQWADSLAGDAGANRLEGGGQDDHLSGAAGNDSLFGGADDDWLSGGAGNDLLDGGDGSDLIDFSDVANGMIVKLAAGIARGDGYDTVRNVENVRGSIFNDVIVGDGNNNNLNGLGGADTIQGGAGDDYLFGGTDNDSLSGGDGNDHLFGGDGYDFDDDGNDRLDGGLGNDELHGEKGNDTLLGGAGDDLIEGGVDRDFVTGGTGADQFIFRNGDFNGHTTGTADDIRDFNHSDGDVIQLNAVDADTRTAGDQNFTFIGTDPFHKVAGELHYQQINGNTYLSGDRNGDGLADFMIRLDGIHDLVASDFVL